MKLLLVLVALLKSGKVLATGGSMLISMAAYSMLYGWKFSLGFIVLLFTHEMGHFLAARQRGLNVGAPTFIPFVGAWIEMKEMPRNAEIEAYVGFGGPLIGTIATLSCYFAARYFDSNLLMTIAYAGFMLNLFNLIPISPLDGGRITSILTPRIWLLGVPVLLGWFLWRPSPMLIVVAMLAFPQLVKAFRYSKHTDGAEYFEVGPEHRLTYSIYYIGLTGFVAMMTFELHNIISPT